MKYLILLLITVQLFGYNFSKIVPQDTVMIMSYNNPKKLKTYLNSSDSFFKSKHYEALKNELMLMMKENVKEKDARALISEFSELFNYPFAFITSLKQNTTRNNFLDYAFLINGKSFQKTILKSLTLLEKKSNFKKDIRISKIVVKGISVTLFNFIKEKQTIAYAVVGENIYFTSSAKYMKKLISYSKNSSLPKLKNLATYYKYKARYKDIIGEFFINIDLILQYTQKQNSNAKAKKYLNTLEINDMKGFYGVFEFKNKSLTQTFHLINQGTLPKFMKVFVTPQEKINIPSFLPATTFSFTGLKFDINYLYSLLLDSSTQKEKDNLNMLSGILGVDIKTLIDSIGSKIFIISLLKSQKIDTIYLINMNDPKQVLSLLNKFKERTGLDLKEQSYLSGKLYRVRRPAQLVGWSLGYKNHKFIIGKTETVKEFMQGMNGKTRGLKSKRIYSKMLKNKHNSQSLLHFSDQAINTFYSLKKSKESFSKMLSDTRDKKTSLHMKKIYKILRRITLKEWKTYFGYSILEVYPERNNIIIKSKSIKR